MRKYPAYTTAELERFITCNPVHVEEMKAEVARRKSGASVIFVTPQIERKK